jgi:hypothetical protein
LEGSRTGYLPFLFLFLFFCVQIYAWKGLRLIARTRFRYFTELSEKKMGNMDDLSVIIDRDKKGTTPSSNGSHPPQIGEELLKKSDLSISNELDMSETSANNGNALSSSSSTPATTTSSSSDISVTTPPASTTLEDINMEGGDNGEGGNVEGGSVKEEIKEEADHSPKHAQKDLSNKE